MGMRKRGEKELRYAEFRAKAGKKPLMSWGRSREKEKRTNV